MNSFPKALSLAALATCALFLPPGGTLATASPSSFSSFQQITSPPGSLKDVPVPPVAGIGQFVINPQAAVALGKALFWDQTTGSDGLACASCHFHSGADSRTKNQLSPGLNQQPPPGDDKFQATASGNKGGPNYTLTRADFPFHQLADILNRNSAVVFDTNDVASSAGSFGGIFGNTQTNGTETCSKRPLDTFNVAGILTRKVEPRNSPTVINTVFFFRNFWDGRANNLFNGVDAFGPRNVNAQVLQSRPDGSFVPVTIALPNSSLASQALAPPVSSFEMSCAGRMFKDLGRKLLTRKALSQQRVDPNDSVLGAYLANDSLSTGIAATYEDLVKASFNSVYWKASRLTADNYTLMEANFSLFFGLAIQAYESTLISDEAPFDRFVGDIKHKPDSSALDKSAQQGLDIFLNKGKCIACHTGPEFTGASFSEIQREKTLVERMLMGDGTVALYDKGFYNIGVRPTFEDLGVGGTDGFGTGTGARTATDNALSLNGIGNPLSFSRQYENAGFPPFPTEINPDRFTVNPCNFAIPVNEHNCSQPPNPGQRIAVDGAFKTPSLRNVALTAPYFHNGGQATLEQVVNFYNRGGDRRGPDQGPDTTGFKDPSNLDPDIETLGLTAQEQADLVHFLRFGLTDPRVTCEKAPFDHPSLALINGHPGDNNAVRSLKGQALDTITSIPQVGAGGLPAAGISCLQNDEVETTTK